MLKNAILLPAGAGVQPEEVLIEDYQSINTLVGGLFDVVHAKGETTGGAPYALCGYVQDDGLLVGAEMNYLATALFGRELVGPCVVTWALSPNGEYDGDDYDMPPAIVEWITNKLLVQVAEAYNESVIMHLASIKMVQEGALSEDDLQHMYDSMDRNVSDGTPLDDRAQQIMERINDYVEDIFDEARQFLGDSMDRILTELVNDFTNNIKNRGEE